ncbi:tail fiber assembly protein [Citrobacter freundii]|uniref:tail fiber assembly protein n=1 Tax=Citrobacter freundii TaxID=546 RepID=UPI0015E51307|nr:tail fiber assembly protein [Citrobacter freundii]QLN53487.1 tail fiber assembly protein [Citrobacter freundii]QLN63174.1 tail fiber assembly protein [Citrobacter freundii]QLW35994.1 tail fiber assembly protein [Citrobacter freundii]HED6952201.1 tail fiber assembly protein [Citrobacter freundii]
MNYLFSPSTRGFYPESMRETYENAGSLPSDIVEVSQSVRDMYNHTPPEGKCLVVVDGLPAWGDIPPPTRNEQIAVAEAERSRLLNYADSVTADWRTELALGEISDPDKAKLSSWMAYKRDVKTIPAEAAIATDFKWPEMPA